MAAGDLGPFVSVRRYLIFYLNLSIEVSEALPSVCLPLGPSYRTTSEDS